MVGKGESWGACTDEELQACIDAPYKVLRTPVLSIGTGQASTSRPELLVSRARRAAGRQQCGGQE